MSDLAKKTITGVKWSAVQQIIAQASSFIFGVLLMRLLTPEDYGLVAMVMFFSGILGIFQDFGLTTSLIQKKTITEDDKQVVFWTMIILSLVLALILFFASDFIAQFYNEEKVGVIAKVFSINFCFSAIGTVDSALFRKDMNFKPMAILQSFAVISGGLTALVLANKGYGYWALVVQSLVITSAVNIGMLIWGGFRPSFVFKWNALKYHVSFGLPLLGSRGVVYLSKNSDKLIIGKFLTKSDLGIYSRAYNLLYLPVHQLSMVFTNVLYSLFSSIQGDKDKIFRGYQFITKSLLYGVIPFLAVFYCNTEKIVFSIFGTEWLGIIELMQVFVFLILFHLISVFRGSVNLSQGHTKLDFKFNLVTSLLDVVAIGVGTLFGLYYIAVFLVVSAGIKAIISLYLVSLSTRIPFGKIISGYVGVSCCFLIVLLIGILSNYILDPSICRILVQLCLSFVVTFSFLLLIDKWVYIELSKILIFKSRQSYLK